MELHSFLRSRRSVRHFTTEPVSDAAVDRILASAVCAPSAHNRQPWRFCVLKSAESKSRLADAMAAAFRRDLLRDKLSAEQVSSRVEQSRARILTAPLVIVLCMDTSEMDVYPDPLRAQAEHTMAIQSTAAAAAQLLLAVHAEGLAGVWTCGPLFAPGEVCSALHLESSWEPQAMVFLGHAAQPPRPKELKPMAAIVRML